MAEDKHQELTHDHQHEHEHQHEHDDDDARGGKHSRAQKKYKKAMAKLGLKEVVGINRVTVRKARSFLISIEEPEIMKSPNSETYIILGKPVVNENPSNVMANELSKPHKEAEKVEQKVEAKVEPNQADENYDEEGIDIDVLKRIMEYTKKPKAVCIKALREHKDEISTIMAMDDGDDDDA